MEFPDDFTWGVAAAAYQIEGAFSADGKGESVWDMFCQQPGKVLDAHTGNVACDHYHRYREDVGLMKEIGAQAYRFSVSWPRVIPAGTGNISQAGLDFYDRLVDEICAAGIQPWVTLFHWDFPYELFCRGGWLNRDSAEWFADYTKGVVERLSDRVRHWITLNEPQCFIGFGHCLGTNAPGLKLGFAECLRAGHHVLLAHGKSVQVLRASAIRPAVIGWAPVGITSIPVCETPEDIAAARASMASTHGGDAPSMGMHPNLWSNTWWGDPVVFGKYPEDGLVAAGSAMPSFPDDDLQVISQPIDFYGANIYSGSLIRAGGDGQPQRVAHPANTPISAFKWPIVPESLRWGPTFLHERYRLPVVITENGISLSDWPARDGTVADPQRIDFLAGYLSALQVAIASGVDVRGYFHWSIMDNFEWAEGYKQRFGLIHVDYETQRRTLKNSATWYRDLIRSNGRILRQLQVES